MMLKFTNAADNFKGNPLYLNREWIVSVFEMPRDDGGSLVTIIYGGPNPDSWFVEESLKEVIKLIDGIER